MTWIIPNKLTSATRRYISRVQNSISPKLSMPALLTTAQSPATQNRSQSVNLVNIQNCVLSHKSDFLGINVSRPIYLIQVNGFFFNPLVVTRFVFYTSCFRSSVDYISISASWVIYLSKIVILSTVHKWLKVAK